MGRVDCQQMPHLPAPNRLLCIMEIAFPPSLRVLIADDHWVVRASLKALLKPHTSAEVFEASSTDEAIDIVRQTSDLDLIILDLNMPGRTYTNFLTEVREIAPRTPVAVFSVSEQRDDVINSLEQGAVGYIPKTADASDILATLSRILNGEIALPQRLLVKETSREDNVLVDDNDMCRIFTACEQFTPRQKEIFQMLATGADNKMIARNLGLSPNTVRVHLQAISARLPARDRSQLVLFATRWKERAIAA